MPAQAPATQTPTTQTPTSQTLLLKQPALSAQHLAFVYAGNLWLSDPDGQHPRPLTTGGGSVSAPAFSPDGQHLAYSSNESGSYSVYTVPVGGGSPRRLTFHPGDDLVRGWTPDGRLLFASARETVTARVQRLYTLEPAGGHPLALALPMAHRGALSADGKRLAYTRRSASRGAPGKATGAV